MLVISSGCMMKWRGDEAPVQRKEDKERQVTANLEVQIQPHFEHAGHTQTTLAYICEFHSLKFHTLSSLPLVPNTCR